MTDTLAQHSTTLLTINDKGVSVFQENHYPLTDRGGLFISEQQQALNFRHRKSRVGYHTDWHVAGDPTLIIITSGCLRISLRDGSYQDFSTGQQFIAADYTPENSDFDHTTHGHKAEVIGDKDLSAIHIKLSKREQK